MSNTVYAFASRHTAHNNTHKSHFELCLYIRMSKTCYVLNSPVKLHAYAMFNQAIKYRFGVFLLFRAALRTPGICCKTIDTKFVADKKCESELKKAELIETRAPNEFEKKTKAENRQTHTRLHQANIKRNCQKTKQKANFFLCGNKV